MVWSLPRRELMMCVSKFPRNLDAEGRDAFDAAHGWLSNGKAAGRMQKVRVIT